MGNSLIEMLLNREVIVESSGLKIRGRLLAMSESRGGRDHKPCVLVLETPKGQCLVRDWNKIVFEGRL
jgi:hypothetical protein